MFKESMYLPNGSVVAVSSVFGGFNFKPNELNVHHSAFPPGWSIILHSEEIEDDPKEPDLPSRKRIHPYRAPTLTNDALYISSISNPSNVDFRPAASPTRQTAMMLWVTLWWYFHQPHPNPRITTSHSSKTPDLGKPKGDWRVQVKKEGIFRGRHLLQKLERMGLIRTEDSSVGTEGDEQTEECWREMFVSERQFWQVDARIFLFTLSPTGNTLSSPYPSRPSSPSKDSFVNPRTSDLAAAGLWSPTTPGPFTSSSHLPTFYPPAPTQYIITNDIRHPLRPKPPRQGETFYTRYIPSLGQYLSFRVASLSPVAPEHHGPVSSSTPSALPNFLPPRLSVALDFTKLTLSDTSTDLCDLNLLHKWMNDPRVSAAWGVQGPVAVQEEFLRAGLSSKHSFPVIGCWDGRPFGYFEIYWVKEDQLGRHVKGDHVGDWDRGIHLLVGEQEFRGPHRVKVWLTALVHFCLLADLRTERVFLEPRVDNQKLISYLQDAGFYKEREISFAHKQAALMKTEREAFEAPAL